MGLFNFNKNKSVNEATYFPSYKNANDPMQIMEKLYGESKNIKIKSENEDDYSNIIKKNNKIIGVKHPFDYELLESTYLAVPIVTAGVDKHVDFVIGSDYKIDSSQTRILKKFNEFVRANDFDVLLKLIVRNMMIYGSSFIEVIWKGNKIGALKLLDSKNMYIRRNNKGKTLGYTQYFGDEKINSEPIYFKPEEIIHFNFNPIGDSPYGTSIIRPLYGEGKVSVLKQFLDVEDSMKRLLKRQVDAKTHVQVGDETHMPTQEVIDNLTKSIEQSRNRTEWITSYLIKMKILGFEGETLDLTPFINHYEEQIIYGLQVPFVLMGKGNVNEGLANVQLETFERRIKSIQLTVSHSLENKLFDRLLGNTDYTFVWDRHEKKDTKQLDTLIRFLSEKFVLTPHARNVVENQILELLGSQKLDIKEYEKSMNSPLMKAIRNTKEEEKSKDDSKDEEKKPIKDDKKNGDMNNG